VKQERTLILAGVIFVGAFFWIKHKLPVTPNDASCRARGGNPVVNYGATPLSTSCSK
jgi:hypothetical protein